MSRIRTALLLPAAIAFVAAGPTFLPAQSAEPATLRFVATARQLGPVGYRDPIGVISPDGDWLAHTSGGSLRVTQTAGGPVQTLSHFARIFSVVWKPDGRSIAVFAADSAGAIGWLLVDARDGAMTLMTAQYTLSKSTAITSLLSRWLVGRSGKTMKTGRIAFLTYVGAGVLCGSPLGAQQTRSESSKILLNRVFMATEPR